jgi:HAD superfamily hydrolase (TIGR01509 family)
MLDVDGTLVDSNRLHAQAWFDAFAEAGIEAGTAADIQRSIGMGSDKLLPTTAGIDVESARGKRLSARRGEIFKSLYLPHLRPVPGAHELVEALRDRGYRLAVATSAKPDELRGLLEVAGVPWLAEEATSGDQVEGSKPDPDVVQATLGRLELPADRVVLIGDTPYDAEAAERAGVAFIGVRSGGWDETGLRPALAVYRDCADLLRHLDASPLATLAR